MKLFMCALLWVLIGAALSAAYIDRSMLVDSADPIYTMTEAFIQELEAEGIVVSLLAGSLIGAERHGKIHPFGDHDVDLAVFSLDEPRIKRALEKFVQQGVAGPSGTTTFGLAYPVTGSIMTIDLWRYEHVDGLVTPWFCRDVTSGLPASAASNVAKDCHEVARLPSHKTSSWLPLRRVHFGPYTAAPVPRTSDPLVAEFGPTWDLVCPGGVPCVLYRPFVGFSPAAPIMLHWDEMLALLAAAGVDLYARRARGWRATESRYFWQACANGYVAMCAWAGVALMLSDPLKAIDKHWWLSPGLRALFAFNFAQIFAATKPRNAAWHAALAIGTLLPCPVALGPTGDWLMFWGLGLPGFVDGVVRLASSSSATAGSLRTNTAVSRVLRANVLVRAGALCCGVTLLWLHACTVSARGHRNQGHVRRCVEQCHATNAP